MRLTVTPEDFAVGKEEYGSTYGRLTETCALTQALKRVFPLRYVSTGMASAHFRENNKQFYYGEYHEPVHEVNFTLDQAGMDVVQAFDNNREITQPVEVELFWEPPHFDPDGLIEMLIQDMQD